MLFLIFFEILTSAVPYLVLIFPPKIFMFLIFRTVGNQFHSGGKWVEIILHGLSGPFSIQAGFYRSTVFLKATDFSRQHLFNLRTRSKEVFLISKS